LSAGSSDIAARTKFNKPSCNSTAEWKSELVVNDTLFVGDASLDRASVSNATDAERITTPSATFPRNWKRSGTSRM
jgi:hypothetical protein